MAFSLDNLDFGDIGSAFKQFLDEYGMPLGLGAQAVGTYLRSQANQRVASAQQQKVNEEAARQREIQAQINTNQAATVPQFSPAAQEAVRQSIADKYRGYITPQATFNQAEYVTGGSTVPQEIRDREAAAVTAGRKKATDYAGNLANLSSYGGLDTANRVTLNDATRSLERSVDQSRGSSAILPYELQGARRAGKGLNLASDVSNGLGSIAFLWGATSPQAKPTPTPAIGTGIKVPQTGTLGIFGGGDSGITPGRTGAQGLRLTY